MRWGTQSSFQCIAEGRVLFNFRLNLVVLGRVVAGNLQLNGDLSQFIDIELGCFLGIWLVRGWISIDRVWRLDGNFTAAINLPFLCARQTHHLRFVGFCQVQLLNEFGEFLLELFIWGHGLSGCEILQREHTFNDANFRGFIVLKMETAAVIKQNRVFTCETWECRDVNATGWNDSKESRLKLTYRFFGHALMKFHAKKLNKTTWPYSD